MNGDRSLLLMGIGGAGSAMAGSTLTNRASASNRDNSFFIFFPPL